MGADTPSGPPGRVVFVAAINANVQKVFTFLTENVIIYVKNITRGKCSHAAPARENFLRRGCLGMLAHARVPLVVVVAVLMFFSLAVFPGCTAADEEIGGATAAEIQAEVKEEISLLENKASKCLEEGDFDTPRQYFQRKEHLKYEIAVLEELQRVKLIRP